MYEPSLEEMEAFGYVGISDNNIYFERIDSFIANGKQKDFATKPYLKLWGAAEIAYNTPEFFGCNVPDSYQCGYTRVHYKNKESGHHVKIKIKKCCCGSWGGGSRCTAGSRVEKIYNFDTAEDAKSFMFRLVLCWLKQESEK